MLNTHVFFDLNLSCQVFFRTMLPVFFKNMYLCVSETIYPENGHSFNKLQEKNYHFMSKITFRGLGVALITPPSVKTALWILRRFRG